MWEMAFHGARAYGEVTRGPAITAKDGADDWEGNNWRTLKIMTDLLED